MRPYSSPLTSWGQMCVCVLAQITVSSALAGRRYICLVCSFTASESAALLVIACSGVKFECAAFCCTNTAVTLIAVVVAVFCLAVH